MRVLSIVLGCLVLSGFIGCGAGSPDNNAVIKTDYDPAKAIKDGLENVKTSGRIGSNFGSVMISVNDLKKKDAAKGEAVEKQLNELTSLKDVAKVKAKAEEIIKSL
jgi:hypothetical protein